MILLPWYSNSRICETPAGHVTPCSNPPLYSRAEVILNFSSVSRKKNCIEFMGHAVAHLVEALRYNRKGRSSIPSGRTMGLRSTQTQKQLSIRNITLGQRRPVRRAYNLNTFRCRLS